MSISKTATVVEAGELFEGYIEIPLVAIQSDEFRKDFRKVLLTIKSTTNVMQVESALTMFGLFKSKHSLGENDANMTKPSKENENVAILKSIVVGHIDYLIEEKYQLLTLQ